MPLSRMAAAISTGKITPVSLLAHMTLTRAVSAVRLLVILLQVEAAVAVHGQFGHPVALLGQAGHQSLDRRVLDPGGDDVALVGIGGEGREDGGVVALGAAAGEDDLIRVGAEQGRHLLAGLWTLPAHLAAEGVHAGGVAVELGEIGQHGLHHLGGHPGGGVVVQIDRRSSTSSTSSSGRPAPAASSPHTPSG